MIEVLMSRGEISWAYGKLFVIDPDQFWVQGMLAAVSRYKDKATLCRGGGPTLTTVDERVMIMASDRVFKIKRGSRVGSVLWLRVCDRREKEMEHLIRGEGDINTVYRSDCVDTVIETLVMAYRVREHGVEGQEMSRQPKNSEFTPQERRVIHHIGCGLDPKAIARVLAIHPKTVSAHKCNVMRKLGLRRTQDLYRWLQFNDLLKLKRE